MNATKYRYATKNGAHAASKTTKRHDARFALIGKFKDDAWRVISLHRNEEAARPQDVQNKDFTEVQIAERI